MANNEFTPTEEAQAIYDILLQTFDGNTEQLIKYYEELIKDDLQSLNEYRVQSQTEVGGMEKYAPQMRTLEQRLQESSNAIKYFSSLTKENEVTSEDPSYTEQVSNSEIIPEAPKTDEEKLIEMFNQQMLFYNQKRGLIFNYANQLDSLNLNTQPIIVQDELASLSQAAYDLYTVSNREKDVASDVEQKISEIKMIDPSFSLSKVAPSQIDYISYEEATDLYRKIASKVKEIEMVSSERPDVIAAEAAEKQCSEALHIARDEIRTISDPSISFDQIINEVEASLNANQVQEEEIPEAPIQNNIIEDAMQETAVQENSNNELSATINEYSNLVSQINALTDEVNEINNKEENLLSNANIDYDQLIELESNASTKENEISILKNNIAVIEKTYFEQTGTDLKDNNEIAKLSINNISYINDFNTFITERNKRIDDAYEKVLTVKQEITTASNDLMKDSCKQRLIKLEKIISMEESLLGRRINVEKQLHSSFDVAKFLSENSYKARKKSIEDKVLNEVLNKYPNPQKLTVEQENQVNDIIGLPTTELDKILQSTPNSFAETTNPKVVTPSRVDKTEPNFGSVPKATRIKCTIKNGVSITTIKTADNKIQKIIYKNLSNKLNVLKDKMETSNQTVLPGLSNSAPYDQMTESMEEITTPTNVIENANSDLLNAMHSIGM